MVVEFSASAGANTKDIAQTGRSPSGEPEMIAQPRHRFHAICPYFAMFPEEFAAKWIERISERNMTIFDPFCGRGTAPFQALLMGRRAIGADINPAAYCVTRAKTNAPALSQVRHRLTLLEKRFHLRRWSLRSAQIPEFFRWAFDSVTLSQLLYLREVLAWRVSDTDCMIAALILGALHGESETSSQYLSNQMPRTISTKPAYSVRFWEKHGYVAPKRDVFDLVRGRLLYRYETPPPPRRGEVYLTDMRQMPRILAGRKKIRAVITSPPYLDVTEFEEDQWLRLWFLGGPSAPTYGVVSKDDRTESAVRYWDFVTDMWRMPGQPVDTRAHVVIRMGGKGLWPEQLVDGLKATSLASGRKVMLADYEVGEIKGRQTNAFRPGSRGCKLEVDCHFRVA